MKKRERKNAYLGQSKELFAMGDATVITTLPLHVVVKWIFSIHCGATLRINRIYLPGTARELDKVSLLFENKDIFRKEQVTEKNLQMWQKN